MFRNPTTNLTLLFKIEPPVWHYFHTPLRLHLDKKKINKYIYYSNGPKYPRRGLNPIHSAQFLLLLSLSFSPTPSIQLGGSTHRILSARAVARVEGDLPCHRRTDGGSADKQGSSVGRGIRDDSGCGARRWLLHSEGGPRWHRHAKEGRGRIVGARGRQWLLRTALASRATTVAAPRGRAQMASVCRGREEGDGGCWA